MQLGKDFSFPDGRVTLAREGFSFAELKTCRNLFLFQVKDCP